MRSIPRSVPTCEVCLALFQPRPKASHIRPQQMAWLFCMRRMQHSCVCDTAISPHTALSVAMPPVGREFFRQARARLNYESFATFLNNIKELNGGRQTREETLRRAREIFGHQNQDLYKLFEGLLSRHLTPL